MTWDPPGRIRTRVLAVLARAATSPDLTAGQFLACAEGLRRVVALADSAGGLNLAVVALRAVDGIQEPLSHVRHPMVRQALDALGAAEGFCEWRRTFRMKRAVPELVDTSEHVRQIAYRVGYSDHGQFDHEFEQLFGLSPSDFRRALAGA
jgi:AraC-like DNA-binding protein